MQGLNFEICLIYLDDIIVYSKTITEHVERLEILFQRLRSHNLKLKPSKCRILRESLVFLGHTVSASGVGTDPQKIESVKAWNRPHDLSELRSFLGLCSYYRRFVAGYAAIAQPLHKLTKHSEVFAWGEEQDQAFVRLKQSLMTAPILSLPVDEGEYILDTDASNYAIGAVLQQVQNGVERVLAYGSRLLSEAEVNYCTTRKEMLAVVDFVGVYRQYLVGRRFTVRSDHSALRWMLKSMEVSGQSARWVELMAEYDFVLIHRAGKAHGNADGLSRPPRRCRRPGICCDVEQELTNECTTSYVDHPPQASVEDEPEDYRPGVPTQKQTKTKTSLVRSILQHGNISAIAFNQASADSIWSRDKVRDMVMQDEDLVLLMDWFTRPIGEPPSAAEIAAASGNVKAYWQQKHLITLEDGVFYKTYVKYEGDGNYKQLIIPHGLRSELFDLAHSAFGSGHVGLAETTRRIQARAYWSNWRKEVEIFYKACDVCARYTRSKPPSHGELQYLQVGEPMERLAIDITGPWPKSKNGNLWILTAIDTFTKYAWAFAIRNHEAQTVARFLVERVFTEYGMPKQILSDRGREFESNLMSELCQQMGIDKVRTTSYKPSTNGVVERFHGTLNSLIAKVVSENQRDWDMHLPYVMSAYRSTEHRSTGFSPNQMMFGREASLPLSLAYDAMEDESNTASQSPVEFVKDRVDKYRKNYAIARKKLRKLAEYNKKNHDVRSKKIHLEVGEFVWQYIPRHRVGRSHKWEKFYRGPFMIIKVLSPVLFLLQKSKKSTPFPSHIDKLKAYAGKPLEQWSMDKSINNDLGNPSIAMDKNSAINNNDAIPRSNGKAPKRKNPIATDELCDGVQADNSLQRNQRPARNTRQPAYLSNYACSVKLDRGISVNRDSLLVCDDTCAEIKNNSLNYQNKSDTEFNIDVKTVDRNSNSMADQTTPRGVEGEENQPEEVDDRTESMEVASQGSPQTNIAETMEVGESAMASGVIAGEQSLQEKPVLPIAEDTMEGADSAGIAAGVAKDNLSDLIAPKTPEAPLEGNDSPSIAPDYSGVFHNLEELTEEQINAALMSPIGSSGDSVIHTPGHGGMTDEDAMVGEIDNLGLQTTDSPHRSEANESEEDDQDRLIAVEKEAGEIALALMVAKGQGAIEASTSTTGEMSRDIPSSVGAASIESEGEQYIASAEVKAAADPRATWGQMVEDEHLDAAQKGKTKQLKILASNNSLLKEYRNTYNQLVQVLKWLRDAGNEQCDIRFIKRVENQRLASTIREPVWSGNQWGNLLYQPPIGRDAGVLFDEDGRVLQHDWVMPTDDRLPPVRRVINGQVRYLCYEAGCDRDPFFTRSAFNTHTVSMHNCWYSDRRDRRTATEREVAMARIMRELEPGQVPPSIPHYPNAPRDAKAPQRHLERIGKQISQQARRATAEAAVSASMRSGVKASASRKETAKPASKRSTEQIAVRSTTTSTLRSEIHKVSVKPPTILPPVVQRLFNQPHNAPSECDEGARVYRIAKRTSPERSWKDRRNKESKKDRVQPYRRPDDRNRRKDDLSPDRRRDIQQGRRVQINLQEQKRDESGGRGRTADRSTSHRRDYSRDRDDDRYAKPRTYREVSPESEVSLEEVPNVALDFPEGADSRRVVRDEESTRAAIIAHPELRRLSITLDRAECDDAGKVSLTTVKGKGKGKGASRQSASVPVVEGKGLLPGSHPDNIAAVSEDRPPPIPPYPEKQQQLEQRPSLQTVNVQIVQRLGAGEPRKQKTEERSAIRRLA